MARIQPLVEWRFAWVVDWRSLSHEDGLGGWTNAILAGHGVWSAGGVALMGDRSVTDRKDHWPNADMASARG